MQGEPEESHSQETVFATGREVRARKHTAKVLANMQDQADLLENKINKQWKDLLETIQVSFQLQECAELTSCRDLLLQQHFAWRSSLNLLHTHLGYMNTPSSLQAKAASEAENKVNESTFIEAIQSPNIKLDEWQTEKLLAQKAREEALEGATALSAASESIHKEQISKGSKKSSSKASNTSLHKSVSKSKSHYASSRSKSSRSTSHRSSSSCHTQTLDVEMEAIRIKAEAAMAAT